MKVRVAGCMGPVRGTALSITAAKWAVSRMGRARTIALAICRDLLSSAYSKIKLANDRSSTVFTISAAVRPLLRSIRMSTGPAAMNEKPRSGVVS